MSNFEHIKALVFDYGNTLIEYGEAQVREMNNELEALFERVYCKPNSEKLHELRMKDIRAPYLGAPPSYIENDIEEISRNLIRDLFEEEASDKVLNEIADIRYQAFLNSVKKPEYLEEFLIDASQKYTLALISNYPDSSAIIKSLEKINVLKYFKGVVVSADCGRVKPHPLPFELVLKQIELEPQQCCFIGDNWLADIQGAKRAGMSAIWTKQFTNPLVFDPFEDDQDPDVVVNHLLDLKTLFKF